MRIIGQERVADMLGVAPKTIVEWQEQGFPIAQRGARGIPSEYESADCISWYVERELAKVRNESPLDRLNRLKADGQEMLNAKLRGSLVPVEELEPKLEAMAITAREWLDSLGGGLASRLAGKPVREIQQLLDDAHREFLTRLSNWRADPIALDEDEAAPAGADE
jgi:phage terminase Nu1 subunit (DNA packaging protein)